MRTSSYVSRTGMYDFVETAWEQPILGLGVCWGIGN